MRARAELLPRCLAATLWATLWASAGAHAREPERLVELASQGPWSTVSGLVAYRQRLWFVNGEKFVNHNAADLHSFDPRTGTSRYERHLFSQDAGDPSVVGGLLVWPFEDARFSAGRGEFAITDGDRWRWSWLPRQQVFHVHASAAAGPELYFATSAWSGGIQRSRDLGRTWDLLYVHPTPEGRVSRFTTLAVLDGTLYAGLTSHSQPGPKLFRLDTQMGGSGVAAVAGWPAGASARTAQAHRGWVYAVHHGADGSAVLRTDGEHVERVSALDGLDVRGFASGDRLWAVAWTGQDDAETLGALVARLGAEDLPAWANGDLVGALSALTGERFGHDLGAWRRWWAARMRTMP